MRYKRLGTTQLTVSELGFGAWGIGSNRHGNSYGPVSPGMAEAAIMTALDHGCTFFDTADVYGHGESERIIGRTLQRAGKLDDVVIASKVGTRFDDGAPRVDFSAEHIRAAIHCSLRRLRREYLDVYQLHNPPLEVVTRGTLVEVLEELRTSGEIRHYGVSIHVPEETRAVIEAGVYDTLQLPYNLFSLMDPDWSEDTLMADATKAGIGVIAREPLASGFLSGTHGADREYGPGDVRADLPESERRVYAALAGSLDYLTDSGITLAQVALRFVLDEPLVAVTVVGIKSPSQARENFAAVQLPAFANLARV